MSLFIERSEFIDSNSPKNLEVYQLTDEYESVRLEYPDRPSFLADGRTFLLKTSDGPRLFHLDGGGRCEKITEDIHNMRVLGLAGDRTHLVMREMDCTENKLHLYRLNVSTGRVEKIISLEGKIPGSECPVGCMAIEAISFSGLRLGALAYLDYGRKSHGLTGIISLKAGSNAIDIISRQEFQIAHLRYYPHDCGTLVNHMLFQQNHDAQLDKKGRRINQVWNKNHLGMDLHVIKDDGTAIMDLPFGRDGQEAGIGHQVWCPGTDYVTSIMYQASDNSYGWASGTRQHMVTGRPVSDDRIGQHLGRVGREDERFLLSQNYEGPGLCHLAVDGTGKRFAFDTFPVWNGKKSGMAIYAGETDGQIKPLNFKYLLNSGQVFNSPKGHAHAHPILSTGGDEIFFNSGFHGRSQAFIIKNIPWDVQ